MRTISALLLIFLSVQVRGQVLHELKMDVIKLAGVSPNLHYEISKGKIGLQVGCFFGESNLFIHDPNNFISAEEFKRTHLGFAAVGKFYLKPLTLDNPFVTYFALKSVIRTQLTVDDDFFVRYQQVHSMMPTPEKILGWPNYVGVGVKSIIKQSRFTLDGLFLLGFDLYTNVSVDLGLDFKLGYLLTPPH